MKRNLSVVCLTLLCLSLPGMADLGFPASFEVVEKEENLFRLTLTVPLVQGRYMKLKPIVPDEFLPVADPVTTAGEASLSSNWEIQAGRDLLYDQFFGLEGLLGTATEVRFSLITLDGRRFEARQVAIAVPPPMAANIVAADFPALADELRRIATSHIDTIGVVVAKNKLSLEPVAGIVGIEDSFFSAVSRDTVPDERFRGFSFHFRPGTPPEKRMERITQVLRVPESDLENITERQTTLPSPREGHSTITDAIDAQTAGQDIAILGNFFAGLAIEDCISRSFSEFARLQK